MTKNGTEYIGRNMRRLREQREITLTEFASSVGVSTATASRWETGDQAIAWRHIVACAIALEVGIGDLLTQPVPMSWGRRHD